jgi:hypothetical protein
MTDSVHSANFQSERKIFFSGEEKNGLRKKHHCHTMWIRGDETVSDHKVHPGHNNFGNPTACY